MKDKNIHIVIYKMDYSGEIPRPINLREIIPEENKDFIPNKRAYAECCDYHFCKLLKYRCGLDIIFTEYNEDREEKTFYGYTLEDIC